MVEYAKSLGPGFRVEVQGIPLTFGISEFVDRVEYESSEDVVDMLKISFNNPDFVLTRLKALLPENEVALWIGYENELKFIGRAVIANVRSNFPPDGMPIVEITAYTKDHLMMEKQPDSETSNSKSGKTKRKNIVWGTANIGDVVKEIAENYNFISDIDPLPVAPKSLVQPVQMSDYDFIKGLSNIAGVYFWVDGDASGKWYLHFKLPSLIQQEKKFTFRYNAGDNTTLFQFQPEIIFKSHYTKIKAQVTLSDGKQISIVVTEDKILNEDPLVKKEDEEFESELHSSEAVQLFVGDYSFRAYPKVGIKDEAELEEWAKLWFEKHRQNFILGEGSVIGLPYIQSRQIHKLKGLTSLYDGDWEFTKVRHVVDPSSGYSCLINCRRIG